MSYYNPQYQSAEEAIKGIRSGDTVFIHSVAAAPQVLINAMVNRSHELRDVQIVHLHTEGPAPYAEPEYEGIFNLNSYFVGSNVRRPTQEGIADYIPVFLSEIPKLIQYRYTPVDVALVQVSPPDKHGYVSLGVSVDATLTAVLNAREVIAQVNPNMPRALGDACIHTKHIDAFVYHESPLHEVNPPQPSEVEDKIGEYVASIVEDGATLQMGIGAIPNAALSKLNNHKRLGVHTEMFSDGLIDLVEKGVITGEDKVLDTEHVVATFVMGSKKTYDFIDNNPWVLMKGVGYTNDVATIRRNPKVTAINSAIEVDLTGQVCADSIGPKHYSGVGGQMDFVRGASYSEGGKPIIALPSTTKKGLSKIVVNLKEGAGVTSTRANVHYIVTEYGIVNLFGKPMQERARLLISIAHPDHRDELARAAYDRFGKVLA